MRFCRAVCLLDSRCCRKDAGPSMRTPLHRRHARAALGNLAASSFEAANHLLQVHWPANLSGYIAFSSPYKAQILMTDCGPLSSSQWKKAYSFSAAASRSVVSLLDSKSSSDRSSNRLTSRPSSSSEQEVIYLNKYMPTFSCGIGVVLQHVLPEFTMLSALGLSSSSS